MAAHGLRRPSVAVDLEELAAVDAPAQSKLNELRESVVAPTCRHGLDEHKRQRTVLPSVAASALSTNSKNCVAWTIE